MVPFSLGIIGFDHCSTRFTFVFSLDYNSSSKLMHWMRCLNLFPDHQICRALLGSFALQSIYYVAKVIKIS